MSRFFNPHVSACNGSFSQYLDHIYGLDTGNFKQRKHVDPTTRRKLKQRGDWAQLRKRINGDPTVPFFGGKEDIRDPEAVEEYLCILATGLALVGFKIVQGGGPGIMELVARKGREGIDRAKASGLVPIWEPKVVSVSLDIDGEPLNELHDEGYHVGPFCALSPRTEALMCLGHVVGIVACPGGDSTEQEVKTAQCHIKQRAELSNPFSNYPVPPSIIYVEQQVETDCGLKGFWDEHFDVTRVQAESRDETRRNRKMLELEQRRSGMVHPYRDAVEAVRKTLSHIDDVAARIYGGSAIGEFLARNNIETDLISLVVRILREENPAYGSGLRLCS